VNTNGTRTIKQSIVANGTPPNCAGPFNPASLGGNLEDANTCHFTAANDKPNVNPLLGPLANNGGPTDTMALLPGSPAIDGTGARNLVRAGLSAVNCPSTDQRGVTRPQGSACDIGAYEVAEGVLGVSERRRCLNSRGGIHGGRLGPARFGRTRKKQRRILKGKRLHSRAGLDRYCVTGGGAFGIGYPTRRMNRRIGRTLSRKVRKRVVFIMTSSRRFNVNRIKPRQRARTARRRLHRERRLKIGRNVWFVVKQKKRKRLLLVSTQRGIIKSVGIGNARLIGGKKGLRKYLRTWERSQR
jgi:hypothetical protein